MARVEALKMRHSPPPATRWVKPVRPGDMIQPSGIVKSKQVTQNSRGVLIDVMVRNQIGAEVATGDAMIEFLLARIRSRSSVAKSCFVLHPEIVMHFI